MFDQLHSNRHALIIFFNFQALILTYFPEYVCFNPQLVIIYFKTCKYMQKKGKQ